MKKINVAIWGLGRAGWGMHIPELEKQREYFNIAGCYDILSERMDRVVARCPGCRKYDSPEAMLADPEIDLIAVAVPSKLHVDCNIQVLESGKYLFAEKPVAINYSEAMRLKAVADRHPGKLFCRQNRRFERGFRKVKSIIDSGVLGDIYEIKLRRHNYQRRSDWQVLTSCAGGQLNNWGPHLVDHALQFLKGDVTDVWGDLKVVAATGDAEDHIKAILRGNGGMIVDVEISGGVAIPSPVYSVYGKLGTLIAWNEQEFRLRYVDRQSTLPEPPATTATPDPDGGFGGKLPIVWHEETITLDPKVGDSEFDMYKYLYYDITGQAPYPVRPDEAFEVVRITEMIRRAANQA